MGGSGELVASLTEIIANDAYSDDIKFELGDGTVVTLGDFRKDYRSKDADYRRKTSDVANERRQLEHDRAAQQAALLEAEQRLAEWTKTVMQGNRQSDPDPDELASDPRYKKLLDKVESINEGLKQRDKQITDLTNVIQADQRERLVQAHRLTLAQLKGKDADLNEEELIRFAQAYGIPRLDHAYAVMNQDRIIERERKAALDAEVPKISDRIKRELSQPVLPSTRLVKPPADAPKNMDQARDAALQDPEILAMLMGTSPT